MLIGQEKFSAAASDDPVEACIEMICASRGTSFVEVEDLLKRRGYIPDKEYSFNLSYDGLPNVILWSACSDEVSDIIVQVLSDKRVKLTPTSPWVYIIDGCFMNLPIAKRPPKNGYKKPHWIPVVLNKADEESE
jgi:hypothetical protein